MNKAPALKFAVTYGRMDVFDEKALKTVFVATAEEVREMALEFIKVIPDDPEDYRKDVKKWKEEKDLVMSHQDDDTFFFMATPIHVSVDQDILRMKAFHKFVKKFDAKVED